LAPARVARVFSDPDTKTIQAIVDEDQLSLAIGRNGQNVRLASELTGWKIDLYSSREWLERGGDGPLFGPLPRTVDEAKHNVWWRACVWGGSGVGRCRGRAGAAAARQAALLRAGARCQRPHRGEGGAPRAGPRGADRTGARGVRIGPRARPPAGPGGRRGRRRAGARLGRVFGGVSDNDADSRSGG